MTICALSTAPGRAGVAVIRISGDGSGAALRNLCKTMPEPRRASLRALRDPRTGEVLDRAIVLWFPAPASFTGEDVAEFHLHGGRAVIEGVLDALLSLGLRLAEPGEFTKRAFENGKIDVTEAEGLADLINADTAAQRHQAIAQSSGDLRQRYDAWRASLLQAMAYVEASLDFAGEADISEDAFNAAIPEIRSLCAELDRALADGRRGEVVREGIQVAIVGPPNAGKSSLLNALAGRDAAIVFDEPGTTRDIVEVTLDLEGFPFVLRDTAGLHETANAVEQEGIRRAISAAGDADVVLLVADASVERPPLQERRGNSGVPFPLEERIGARGHTSTLYLKVQNKNDLAPAMRSKASHDQIAISAKTGEGLDTLKAALIAFARNAYGGAETPLITRARHRQEIERARAALALFMGMAESGDQTELAAEPLREAADALGRLTGRIDVEDVLGQIFSEFCIGK